MPTRGKIPAPSVAQAAYPIWPEDDVPAVRQRGLKLEYEVYSQCVNWLVAGQVVTNRTEGGRPRAVITDPAYRRILRRWVDLAFE